MILAATTMLAACGEKAAENTGSTAESAEVEGMVMSYYGETITADEAISVDELKTAMNEADTLETKVKATINETCAKMGCWMTVDAGNGDDMTVFMKDHSFFVPKEGCVGKEAIFSGIAYYDTLSVEYLRHLAEDANKSQEEIDAITEPRPTLAFDAAGVIIEGVPQPAEGEMEEEHDHEGHDHDHEGEDHAHDSEEATS